MQKLDDATLMATAEAIRLHGSQRKTAKALGIGQSRIPERMAEAKKRGLIHEIKGQIEVFETKIAPLPKRGKVVRYLLTCAQDHTKLHQAAWKNLQALATHYNAEIMVSTFKYNKDAQGQRAAAKWETREQELVASYPHEIIPYVCDDRVDIAPNITFCGELNVLPTAINPLEGLEQYTYRKSTIVPHPKLALASVPTMKGEGVKLMFTTGCITQRNYIKRKVGFKAEHFHSYGALLVEIDNAGHWYCRQLVHGPDGAMHDLNIRAINGKIETDKQYFDTPGKFVADITWGDLHASRLDPDVATISWGTGPESMLETLRPATQHVHDALDFSGRSHHTRKDPHAVFKAHWNGEWVLTNELQLTAKVLWEDVSRMWCETFIVDSNHDRHLDKFLKEVDWRDDPVNARLILALNLRILDAIIEGTDDKLCIHEDALRLARHNMELGIGPHKVTKHTNPIHFLHEDESHIILPDINNGIECGLHGDRGANGAKGTITGIAKMDRKVNGADKHAVAIMNHAYFCGTSGKLDQGWNKGPSSWTHAHIITYSNGTRAIISVWKGKWKA